MEEARGERRLDSLCQICGAGRGEEGVSTPLVIALFETDAVYNPKP